MSSTAGDEGWGGRFGAKGVRTRGLPLVAIFIRGPSPTGMQAYLFLRTSGARNPTLLLFFFSG